VGAFIRGRTRQIVRPVSPMAFMFHYVIASLQWRVADFAAYFGVSPAEILCVCVQCQSLYSFLSIGIQPSSKYLRQMHVYTVQECSSLMVVFGWGRPSDVSHSELFFCLLIAFRCGRKSHCQVMSPPSVSSSDRFFSLDIAFGQSVEVHAFIR